MTDPSTAQTPTPTPFPARTLTKKTTIASIPTTCTSLHFSDKLLVTVSQNGRLAHWIHVPLLPSPTGPRLPNPQTTNALLPSASVTATTILGGTVPALDTLGQTLATSVASALQSRNPGESRTLVLGLGLDRAMVGGMGAGEFGELVGVVLDVL